MHRNNEDPIGRLLITIEQEHPRPWPEDKPSRRPLAPQLCTGQREGFESAQRTSDTFPNVCRQVECNSRLFHVPPRLRGDNDLRHSGSQLVERRSFAASRLGETVLRPLPRTGNGVEDLGDPRCVGIGVIERRRQQRASQSALLNIRALGKSSELSCMLAIEGHVDALRPDLRILHEIARVVSLPEPYGQS